MVRRILFWLVLSGTALTLASCNTVQGVGRDISSAGEAITEAAGGI